MSNDATRTQKVKVDSNVLSARTQLLEAAEGRGAIAFEHIIEASVDHRLTPDQWSQLRNNVRCMGLRLITKPDVDIGGVRLQYRQHLMSPPPFPLHGLPKREAGAYTQMEMGTSLIERSFFTTPMVRSLAPRWTEFVELEPAKVHYVDPAHSDLYEWHTSVFHRSEPWAQHAAWFRYLQNLPPSSIQDVRPANQNDTAWLIEHIDHTRNNENKGRLHRLERQILKHYRKAVPLRLSDILMLSGDLRKEWMRTDENMWNIIQHAATHKLPALELFETLESGESDSSLEKDWQPVHQILNAHNISLEQMCIAQTEMSRGRGLIRRARATLTALSGVGDATHYDHRSGKRFDHSAQGDLLS